MDHEPVIGAKNLCGASNNKGPINEIYSVDPWTWIQILAIARTTQIFGSNPVFAVQRVRTEMVFVYKAM